jgi:DNA primase
VQFSELALSWQELTPDDFADPELHNLFQVIREKKEGLTSLSNLVADAPPELAALITELTVEPMRVTEPTSHFMESLIARLREVSVTRKISELKSSLQRLDPESTEYAPAFAELIGLEALRRSLHEKGLGEALL